MENTNNDTFTYTYSATQQEEVKKIAGKYMPREESKMDQLRKLDQSATKPGKTLSIAVGTVGSLIMGAGMSCVMVLTDLFIPGIAIGIVGIAGVALAYPIYNAVTRKRREKIAPQIKKLSEELMRQQ